MREIVMRRCTCTSCDVVDQNGEVIGEFSIMGRYNDAGVLNAVRKQHGKFVTIRNVRRKAVFYQMPLAEFIKVAKRVEKPIDKEDR